MSILKIVILAAWLLSEGGCGSGSDALDSKTQEGLDRAKTFIEKFKSSHSRLPSRDDYRRWWQTNDLYNVVDYQLQGESNAQYYVLYIWLGERMVKYSSKNNAISE
jgi:hypothetical protein